MIIKLSLKKLVRLSTPITALRSVRMASTTPKIKPGEVPEGYKAHTESSTTILVPEANTAFLNPVQQYNRDLSIAVIRSWNEMRKEEAVAKQEYKRQKHNGKGKGKKDVSASNEEAGEQPEAGPSKPVSGPRQVEKALIISSFSGRLRFWRHYLPQVYDQFDMRRKSRMSEQYLRMIFHTPHAKPCV